MHFICSPFGSSGDVYPMLGLALALRAQGQQVTLITSGYFAEVIEKHGLPFIELGTREDFLRLTARKELWKPLQAFQFLYREAVAPTMQRHYEILAELQREGPIVAISNLFGFGALVAHEHLAVPLVILHLQPSVIWSDIDPPRLAGLVGPRWCQSWFYRVGERLAIDPAVCPSLNAWRAELGLPPVRRITRWWHSAGCVACLFPDWFARPQADWPPNLIQTGSPLWNEQGDEQLPRSLENFLADGDRPIAFTPGSANQFGRRFFAAAVDACRRLDCRGLLLTRFADQLPAKLPSSVLHVPYAPFSRLLPGCRALVHHGGIGSMSQAMAAGIPQVIVALAHDQFDNARRARRLGIGGSIELLPVSGRRLAARLSGLLDRPSTAERCRELAERLATERGLEDMAAAIIARAKLTSPPRTRELFDAGSTAHLEPRT